MNPHAARVLDRRSFYAYLFLMVFFISCEEIPSLSFQYDELLLKGQITNPKEEISSMTLYNDKLILLPENLNGYMFGYHWMRLRIVSLRWTH